MPQAKKTEAEMGPFENVASDSDQEFAGAQYMQLLQRIQANYNLSGQVTSATFLLFVSVQPSNLLIALCSVSGRC